MTPPRRIGQKTDYPLHAPPQRHHADPAAARDQIRDLPNHSGRPGDVMGGNSVQQASDHAGAVQAAIKAAATQDSHPSTNDAPASPPSRKMTGGPGGDIL